MSPNGGQSVAPAESLALDRRIGLGLLTFYGVGVMVGAGIYVLIGQIVAMAGPATPWAFLLAGLVAALSAYSFAELAARIPESAGEAAYVERAFGKAWLSTLVGFAVVAVGLISAAAILKGGVGYLLGLISLPRVPTEYAALLLMGAIAAVGVVHSLTFAAIFTAIEVLGLLIVSAIGLLAEPVVPFADILSPKPALEIDPGILLGATLLAFFAFIGFEDMVNMAEETIAPERTMPKAIFLAVAIATTLYCLVAIAVVRAADPATIGQSERPLAMIFERGTGLSSAPINAIAVFATFNGVLVQIVMAARVLFGLGRQRSWLAWFHHLNARFRTPWRATAIAVLVIALLIGAAPIETLASVTSTILLLIFALLNLALLLLKRHNPPPPGAPNAPAIVPILGLTTALALLLFQLPASAN